MDTPISVPKSVTQDFFASLHAQHCPKVTVYAHITGIRKHANIAVIYYIML